MRLRAHRAVQVHLVLSFGIVIAAVLVARGCGGRTGRDRTARTGGAAGTSELGGAGGTSGNAAVGGLTGTSGSGGTGSGVAGSAGAVCYRDPYLPENYEPPCEQPPTVANCDEGWCTIEPGCFFLGSPWCEWGRALNSANPIQVTLTHRFHLQQRELTQGEWTAAGLPNPSGPAPTPTAAGDCLADDCPVGNVTWYEALAYANLRSQREGLPACYQLAGCTGELGAGMVCATLATTPSSMYECLGYRVPTGAEWEYAARAGTRTSVYTGDIVQRAEEYTCVDDPVLTPIAWYCFNSGNVTHPGGLLQPNGWGLYDLIGNAQEWTTSVYATYEGGPHTSFGAVLALENGAIPGPGLETRGGLVNAWPQIMRASSKGNLPAYARGPGIGFRLVRTLPPTPRSP